MKPFHAVLINALAGSLANTFVWFAVTFWVYLQTRSVVATSVLAGVYTATTAASGFFLGSLVDRYEKKTALLLSSLASLLLYGLAGLLYLAAPRAAFADAASPALLAFIVLTLVGAIAGNVRPIALATLVTLLVPEPGRAKANGLVGTANGIAFFIASIFSGLVIGVLGMGWMLALAVVLTAAVIGHLLTLSIPTRPSLQIVTVEADGAGDRHADTAIDLAGTIRVIRAVPGLAALLVFQTFNNFLGGVFMALMDAYGLSLVSVEVWGAIFGVLSLGFIVGGLVVARVGLGPNPLRTLFLVNLILWTVCVLFPLQASIVPLTVGMAIWLCLIPAAEAAEQTLLQTLIPPERQGRVFGFAQSIEQAAAPISAFLVGPLAQLLCIPFMTTGAGADLIGGWFGTGAGRGLALVFIVAGLLGLAATLLALRSGAYRRLAARYRHQAPPVDLAADAAPALAA
jgi:DHA3 family multidrug efflux protein-like MFS transporter